MSKAKAKTGCVEMVGPDVQMDQRGSTYDPANALPIKCRHCTLPDLDSVPQPYVLTKGVSTPSEISPAQMGNFLIRERVHRILEFVVPNSCRFFPTIEAKTKKKLEWLLAVPARVLEIPGYKVGEASCPKCHEPKTGYVYATSHEIHLQVIKQFDSEGVDIFKSRNWGSIGTAEDALDGINRARKESGEAPQSWKEWSAWAAPGVEPPTHPERWTRRHLSRELYFSVRLDQLLQRVKIRGQLVRSSDLKDVKTSPNDEVWIEDKLRLLVEKGLVDGPKALPKKGASSAQQWFSQYLKKNSRKAIKEMDFASVERKQKLVAPQDYKEFITKIGQKSFADVNGLEGSTTTVLPPNKLDFKSCRRGKLPDLEGDDADVDGVMFASTDFGDCFVFDVSIKERDYPVYWYRHEENTMEPFAPNFAECIKRFVLGN